MAFHLESDLHLNSNSDTSWGKLAYIILASSPTAIKKGLA